MGSRVSSSLVAGALLVMPALAASAVLSAPLPEPVRLPVPDRGPYLWANSYYEEGHVVAQLDGFLYFGAGDLDHGWELWRTDGTPAGTAMVADLQPGAAGSHADYPAAFRGRVFFNARTPGAGRELWATDGTAAGTELLDLVPGPSGSNPGLMAVAGDRLFFTAYDDLHGEELWASDGTAGGTRRVRDIAPGPMSSVGWRSLESRSTAAIDGVLYFAANDGTSGRELWRSDGTEAGTWRVADLRPGAAGSLSWSQRGSHIAVHDGVLFFDADDGTHGLELWYSDGTEAGTGLVADIRPGPSGSGPRHFESIANRLLFTADDGVHSEELWRSDGTAAGTEMVIDILPGGGRGGASSDDVEVLNGLYYFQGRDLDHGLELWRSDGTAAGTGLVADVAPGATSSYSWVQTPLENLLFFTAETPGEGMELWVTDGTTAGTELAADLLPGADSSWAIAFAAVDHRVLLETWDPDGAVYSIDLGTPELLAEEERQEVLALGLPAGTETSLVVKLDAALAAVDQGNVEAALGQLQAFINAVEAQRGGSIPEADAERLIAATERILARLADGQ